MKVLVVGHDEVPQLLPMARCVTVMEGAFRSLAMGEAILPLRQGVFPPDRKGVLGLMPAYLGSPRVLGAKIITVFPDNISTPYESHQGAVLIFEAETGRLLAMIDAGSVTGIRTAAVSALATRLLAREDAAELAILGSGTQASAHLAAMRTVRPIRRVRVWSRTPEHGQRFAEREKRQHRDLQITVAESAQAALAGADLVCTVTAARAPILLGAWLGSGVHINAIGASIPPFRELDTQAVVASRFFVDRRESALKEADDFRIPQREGAIDEDHIRGEIGDLVTGKIPGRTSPKEITVFKSLGLAIEDLAAAHYVYTQALAQKRGSWVEFGSKRIVPD